ncbi:hypothetical protein [Hyalangium rubrum]|uniref:Uncharacterized protein n=1 Tax=Hyalangium rubrum TaxID=3103134 RepID=A0ABU5H374_9BACT|nr:hypothetical protein [Hyalangium sp. s54d21]MDY7227913.1 hypothetical protein [Hyalangium sp. s54d21]
MNFYTTFADIAPRKEDDEKEPFTTWHARVQHRIPHVPVSVAEHWLHRHWDQSPHYWLDLARLRFRLERWTNARLAEIRFGFTWGNHGNWQRDLIKPKHWLSDHWLWLNMEKHGTWPAPIIVLENANDAPNSAYGKLPPLLLIEGHHRLEFARALSTLGKALPDHEVWLATLV